MLRGDVYIKCYRTPLRDPGYCAVGNATWSLIRTRVSTLLSLAYTVISISSYT